MQTIVYIDASNLKFGVEQSNWSLDYKSFRSWLRDKFDATRVVLFLGLVPRHTGLYNSLQRVGYELSFRPITIGKDGKTKGNVDGELILQVAQDYYEKKLSKAVLVSGDGDYYCIVEFLKEKNVPVTVVSPNKKYLSLLLKRTNVPIVILEDFKHKLVLK